MHLQVLLVRSLNRTAKCWQARTSFHCHPSVRTVRSFQWLWPRLPLSCSPLEWPYKTTHFVFRMLSPLVEKHHSNVPPVYLSDICGRILLCIDLRTEGPPPSAALHHRVHWRGHLLIARVWSGIASLLLVLNLLRLFLQLHGWIESAIKV